MLSETAWGLFRPICSAGESHAVIELLRWLLGAAACRAMSSTLSMQQPGANLEQASLLPMQALVPGQSIQQGTTDFSLGYCVRG